MGGYKLITSIISIFTLASLTTYVFTTNSMEKERKENVPQYYYTEKEMDKVSAYIEQQYGEYENVMHEIVSPDIHCDIVVIPPTEEQPYYKLVTLGAGAYKMNIPKKLKSAVCDRAEYVIFLPNNWNMESDKEEDYWLALLYSYDSVDPRRKSCCRKHRIQFLCSSTFHRKRTAGSMSPQDGFFWQGGSLLPVMSFISRRIGVQVETFV